MLQNGVLSHVLIQLVGFRLLSFKLTADHGLGFGGSIVLVRQPSLNIFAFSSDRSFYMRDLFLKFTKFWIPRAKLCAKLSILGSEFRFLRPQYLQCGAGSKRT